MRWTEEFYVVTASGACAQLAIDVDGHFMDASKEPVRCERPGEHPHPPKGRLVGADRVSKGTAK